MCNVKNENVRTYSPSMARCCPPLAAAHPRVSPLLLSSLFILLSGNTHRLTHILSLSALIFLIFLSSSSSPPPLSLSTLMSFRCIRIGLRLQQPFSAGSILPLSPSLPSLSPLSRFKSLPPRFFPSSLYLPCANTSALIIDSIVALRWAIGFVNVTM